jgi:hypothetical protein
VAVQREALRGLPPSEVETIPKDRLVGTWKVAGGAQGQVTWATPWSGTFSDDHSTLIGDWVYPGGGGSGSTMTRVG